MGNVLTGPWKAKYTKILVYAEKGLGPKEISEKVKMNEKHIGRIMNRPDFLLKRNKIEGDAIDAARELFKAHVSEAVMKVVNTMRKGKSEERLQYDAAKEILYQVGLKPAEIIETRRREYTTEEMESALSVTREVEEITKRLSCETSNFLVEATPVPASVPVPASNSESAVNAENAKTANETAIAESISIGSK